MITYSKLGREFDHRLSVYIKNRIVNSNEVNKFDGKGMAIAGIITGGLGVVICLIYYLALGTTLFTAIAEEMQSELY